MQTQGHAKAAEKHANNYEYIKLKHPGGWGGRARFWPGVGLTPHSQLRALPRAQDLIGKRERERERERGGRKKPLHHPRPSQGACTNVCLCNPQPTETSTQYEHIHHQKHSLLFLFEHSKGESTHQGPNQGHYCGLHNPKPSGRGSCMPCCHKYEEPKAHT